MKKFFLPALIVILIALTVEMDNSFAQNPTAVIKVEALSPSQIAQLGWTTPPSSGLKVVGKGELVYLSGHEAVNQAVTTYNWSLDSRPAGSHATLDSTKKSWTTFVADTIGQYQVKLTITTIGGSASTTIKITGALYVGAGGVGGIPIDYNKGQCSFCHSDKNTEWKKTGHATFFQEAIDGLKESSYNASCIECHTVGYNSLSIAHNDGFDDIATKLGWSFPAVLQAGNWSSLVANYPALAKRANIQCENCHGPGSIHFGAEDKIDVTLDEGVCSRCHDEEPYHLKGAQWRHSMHAVGIASAASRTDCTPCHSGYGFIGLEADDATGFPQVSCSVCHDPHNADNPSQLRKMADVTLNNGTVISFGGKGKSCMSCHKSRRDAETYAAAYHDHFSPHRSNQADMLAGSNAISFGLQIPSSNHKQVIADGCVSCHMAATPAAGQPGHDTVGEHSFAMRWVNPNNTTQIVENVAVCQPCHGAISAFADLKAKEDYDGDGMIESAQDEVKGLLSAVGKLLPPLGDPTVTVTADYTPAQLKAAYNYLFVAEDGSYGLHNFQYAVHLLQAAHEALSSGDVGAGAIAAITDVPVDQGKQVRIIWNRFGDDGISSNPVKFYALWRRADDIVSGTTLKKVPIYESFASLPSDFAQLGDGVRVLIADQPWDYVGSVVANSSHQYATIAPTLFDSTKFAGMHWSVFRISGHSDIPALTTISAPDSGYSVDNLLPAAPTHFTGFSHRGTARLSWDESTDEDFKFYAIYRSTVAGFNPQDTPPLATTAETVFTDINVTIGTSYYYRISAFDFSGNESDYSPEFALLITKVEETAKRNIPIDWVLAQNFPNPFNPTTEITFGLPNEAQIKLAIFNSLGAQVRVLADDLFTAGYHTLVWDGCNEAGQVVGPGIYFYRLMTPATTLIQKMILLK